MYRKKIPDPVIFVTDPLIVVPAAKDAEKVPEPLGYISPERLPADTAVNPRKAPDEETFDPEKNDKLAPTIVCFIYKY